MTKPQKLKVEGFSIGHKITIVLLVTTLIAIIITGSIYYFSSQKEVVSLISNHLKSVATQQRNQIALTLEQQRDRLALIASRTQLRLSLKEIIAIESTKQKLLNPNTIKINKIIADTKQAIPEFIDVMITDLQGKILVSTQPQTILSNIDDHYIRALDQQQQDIFVAPLNELENKLILIQYLYLQGEKIGLLVVESSLTTFQTLLNTHVGVGSSEETYIVINGADGQLKPLIPFKQKLTRSQMSNIDPFNTSMVNNEVNTYVDHQGTEVFAITYIIPEVNWGLVYKIDVEDALHLIEKQSEFLVFSLLIVALIVAIVAFFLGRSISQPVIDIAYVATLIANGDLTKRIESFTKDELGLLGLAFNQMADKLIEANGLLEKTVNDKTSALINANQGLRDLNLKLEQLTVEDSLTQIANRRAFDLRFNSEWKRCSRENIPLAVVLLDVDFFKVYNDTFGHLAGDDCLKKVASIIKSSAQRDGDLAARYGGEEFVLILPNTNKEECRVIAENIRKKLAELALPHPGSVVGEYVTLSMGAGVVIPDFHGLSADFFEKVDKALYQAKSSGRDCLVFIA